MAATGTDVLREIAAGKRDAQMSVRTLLSLFGAQRRGSAVVEQIDKELTLMGLTTAPPFASVPIDAEFEIVPSTELAPSAAWPASLDEVVGKLERGGPAPVVTVRQLLEWFGARRRGYYIRQRIRRVFEELGIGTEPAFDDAGIDDTLTFRIAAPEPSGTDAPAQRENTWPRQLDDIAAAIAQGEPTDSVTVRTLLRWFGYEKRGVLAREKIREVLKELELETVPDFESAYIDAEISFQSTAPVEARAPDDNDPGAHAQNSVSEHPPVVLMPEPPGAHADSEEEDIDPTLRVARLPNSNLASIGKKLIVAAPDASIAAVVTLMLLHDVSQIPLMTNEREVRGVVTWRTIGRMVAAGPKERPVFALAYSTPHREIGVNESIFRALRMLREEDYTLVRSKDRQISGILTSGDLAEHYHLVTEPFLLLQEIEQHLRKLLNGRFSKEEFEAMHPPGEHRPIGRVADMTLGDCLRLLSNEAHFSRLELAIDRKSFLVELDRVRQIRNDVMHFDDIPTEDEREHLRRFSRFMQELDSIRPNGHK